MGGDRVVGSIAQNSEAKVTLAGGVLEMGGTAPAITTVSNGVLELPAVEASAAVNVNAAANSGKVVLAALQPRPKIVFDITKVSRVFEIVPTVEDAHFQ